MSKKKKTKSAFRTYDEYKETLFPVSYRQELEKKAMQNPGTYGVKLADDFLEGIRQQLLANQ